MLPSLRQAEMSPEPNHQQSGSPYPDVPARADFPAIERRLLQRWEAQRTFERSVEQRSVEDEFVFYDGPPFANGLPHYGHLLTGYVKDVVPRYQTMRGHRVERRFGWDCHGLPAEMGVEQELGVSGHIGITEFGIDRFNARCRSSVMRYTEEWKRYVTRQARWVDFSDDYKTMDLDYMESVIWAFSQLYDKGLVYEAYRVMPYSWGAETPLSNFEIRLDDATRPRQDPALTVAFTVSDPTHPVTAQAREGEQVEVWAWTTTPWTLPSNLALAAGTAVRYSLVRTHSGDRAGRLVLLGSGAIGKYGSDLGTDHEVLGTFTGSELAGLRYAPLFEYFADHANSFRVLVADWVSDDDGTGIVHLAPGFGEDDQVTCEAAGIDLVVPVDDSGRFTDEVPEWVGVNVFDANPDIARTLRERGRLVRHDTHDHNYPHCWRTDTPIIYKAVSSWYVEVTAVRDRLVALNEEINWIPQHVRDGQFGKWLEGARDWSISRNRFWGSPIPVWRSDDPAHPRTDVYGSLEEIEADFGVRPDDLHRPYVDELVRPNPDDPTGRSMMRRVPEVLDCWFESGSMPFAQRHYPFEHGEWFEDHSPADFIVEYIAQTRGWFYTMHVLSGALFDRPAFSNVICHGVVLDHEGRKLSKKLRNYPDPEEVMESHGSDALRWHLMSSPILRGGDLRISADASDFSEVVRLVLNPIWNAYSFFTLYANADGHRGRFRTDASGQLDRYILAKTAALAESVTVSLDAFEIAPACAEIHSFLDALNNWYIRRSRERFWAPGGGDEKVSPALKADAYDTLYTVLVTLMELTAPLLPFVAEEIWLGLTGNSGGDSTQSVHLADWPDVSDWPHDPELVEVMDCIRDVCSAALSLREDNRLRARLPLQRLTIAGADLGRLDPVTHLVRDEVNVKEVVLSDDLTAVGSFVLRPDARVLGPRLGSTVQDVIRAARSGDWTASADGSVEVAGVELAPEEFELALQPREGAVATALQGNAVLVELDIALTPALEAEGMARDVVRLIQQARKDAGLHVTDRIRCHLDTTSEIVDAIEEHRGWVSDAILATVLTISEGVDDDIEARVEGHPVGIRVSLP